eukprot:SAG31_NODE_62_length_28678_cov_21.548270_8_plen_79_part_00
MRHQLTRGRRWLRHLSHEVPGDTATRAPRQAPRVRPSRVPVVHDGVGRLLLQNYVLHSILIVQPNRVSPTFAEPLILC